MRRSRVLFSRHRYNEWNFPQNLLSQINTITSFVKIKTSDFQNQWILAAPGESRRQQADFFCA